MDPYRRYDSGGYSPSGSNHYPNPAYPHNYPPPFPPQHPPPPQPPNYGYEGYWADPHLRPPYPPPPPQAHYPPAQSSPAGWPSPDSFSQGSYPYSHQESFHHDSSNHQYQSSHSSPNLHYENGQQSGRLPNYSAQSPHVETNATSSSSTSASMHPLNNLMSEMRLSDSHRPLDFSSPGGSFHRPSLTPCQSYHSSDSSSPSLSSNQGSFSGNSFQYGQYSFNSHDRISSDSALAQNQIVPFDPSAKSLRVVLLHGTLDIWVYEAKNLPNMDIFSERMRQVFTKTASGKVSTKIEDSVSHQQVITSDPYVSISLSSAIVARTRVISNDQNPVWTQHFSIHVAHNVAEISFIVKDSDFIGAQLIGTVEIPAERLMSGQKIENWYPVLGPNGKVCRAGAALKLAIQFFPVEYQALYRFGIGAGPDYSGVPNTYFPLRKGGKVTLYQDAHVPDNLLPSIKLDHRATFKHGKCWQDISEAIVQARRLIYITGWSIYDKIKLVRGSSNSNVLHAGSTLGDLLKYKSQEGLRVLLLVWDDPTSRDILGFQKDGLMQTHDEETRRFFKHSSVQVLLCPRSAGKRHSWVKQQEVGAIFTHHQKSVLVDSEAIGGRRKITAFIGGLDLCDGRFDTPEHHLFRSLGTFHKDDYHNPTFTAGIDSGGPREPWHDLHCRIDGPAAYDVLYNFEQRWTKAAKRHGLKKLKRWNDDALLQLDRLPEIIGISELNTFNDNDPETWHVQVFRSIDSGSVKGFPKDVKEAETRNLVYLKNLIVDMSIHTAYVEAIRSAQHFIYIENQYFIGSSYNWSAHKDIGANNMIPMELALKIADKIRAHERFAVYVLIPMWPEGIPTSIAMQRILYWQGQTMQMMYETIFKALEEVGLEKTYDPQDYLNFFCLGNREARDNNEAPSKSAVPENTPHARALKNRRFMIYVHSKGMIVDDEYVILGSANINQRSMEGSRDTEIAMGAYQPQYTWSKKQEHPHGQVYGYRISLWAEHLAVMEDCFQRPESLECVRRVRDLSENYWKQFSANEVTEMKGHFMKYPVKVEANMTMAAAIIQPALGFGCRYRFFNSRVEHNGLRSKQRLFLARCGIDYTSSARAAVASQLFGGNRELRIVAAIDPEVSRRSLHPGKDKQHSLDSHFWTWMFLSGFSSSSSFAEVAFASEAVTPNAVYEVGELFEFGIQLIYLGALISLLGVGSFFVVRQVVIRRELENAAKELQERVRSGEANAVEYFELGAVMLRKKFYPLAAKYLEQAIEKWEGDVQDLAQVHNALGFSYASDGKLDKGIIHYEKAVELQPGYVTAWNNMGDAFEKKKDLKAALKAYNQALIFDPNDKVARTCRDFIKERVDLFEGVPSKPKGYKKM